MQVAEDLPCLWGRRVAVGLVRWTSQREVSGLLRDEIISQSGGLPSLIRQQLCLAQQPETYAKLLTLAHLHQKLLNSGVVFSEPVCTLKELGSITTTGQEADWGRNT